MDTAGTQDRAGTVHRAGFECRSYTHARRFPWMIGKIGDWSIPFGPFTPTQAAAGIGSLALLWQTRESWTPTFGLWGSLAAFLAVPLAGVALTRRAKIEGRSPLFALAGWTRFLTSRGQGRSAGGSWREPRERHLARYRYWIAARPAAGARHEDRAA
ncbi:MAG: hypothetical protein IT198_17285 [Acidimicrobiia bacterium]|nr:hypothetical protein [Acidimicrobiia bacterium]